MEHCQSRSGLGLLHCTINMIYCGSSASMHHTKYPPVTYVSHAHKTLHDQHIFDCWNHKESKPTQNRFLVHSNRIWNVPRRTKLHNKIPCFLFSKRDFLYSVVPYKMCDSSANKMLRLCMNVSVEIIIIAFSTYTTYKYSLSGYYLWKHSESTWGVIGRAGKHTCGCLIVCFLVEFSRACGSSSCGWSWTRSLKTGVSRWSFTTASSTQ